MSSKRESIYNSDQFDRLIMRYLSHKRFYDLHNIFINQEFYNPLDGVTKKHDIVIHAPAAHTNNNISFGSEKFNVNSPMLYDPMINVAIPTFRCYAGAELEIIDPKNNIGAHSWARSFKRIIDLKTGKYLTGDDPNKDTDVFDLFPETGTLESYGGEVLKYSVKDGELLMDSSKKDDHLSNWSGGYVIPLGVWANPWRIFYGDRGSRRQYLKNLETGKTDDLCKRAYFENIFPDQNIGIVQNGNGNSPCQIVSLDKAKVIGDKKFTFEGFVFSDGYFAVKKEDRIYISGTEEQAIKAQETKLDSYVLNEDEEKGDKLLKSYIETQRKVTEFGAALGEHIAQVK